LRTLREFIRQLDGAPAETPDLASGDVVTGDFLGFDFAAVLLPSEVLTEDRVSRMSEFWNLIADRDVVVIALSEARSSLARLVRSYPDCCHHSGRG
jgi:hypothetical protein